MSKYIIQCFFLLFVTQLAYSQASSSSGLLIDANSTSLGGSLVVQARNPSAVYWNPALLAGLKDRSISLSVNDPFAFNLVSLTQFVPLAGTFGVSLIRIPGTSNTVDRGNFAWGRDLNRWFSVGGAFNVERFGNDWSSSAGFGLFLGNPRVGTLENRWHRFAGGRMSDRVSFGLTVQDIPVYQSIFDTSVLLGFSYLLPHTGLLVNTGYHFYKGKDTAHLGLGLEVSNSFMVFAGIDQLELDRLALGAGYAHDNFAINASYSFDAEKVLLTLSARISPDPTKLAEPYFQSATNYANEGNYRMASKDFKKYLAFELSDKRTESVRELLYILDRKASKIEKRVDSLFAVVRYLLHQEEPQFLRAALILTNIRELDPDNAEAGKQLLALKPAVDVFVKRSIQTAIDLFESHDYMSARKMFQRGLMFEKNNATANYYISSIDKILNEKANDHFLQGVGYYRQENYERAKTEFSRALELNASLDEAHKYLRYTQDKLQERVTIVADLLAKAHSLEKQEKFVEATDACIEVLEIDPDNIEAKQIRDRLSPKTARYVNRKYDDAMTFYARGNLKQAQALLGQVLSINPNHSDARRSNARIKQELKTRLSFLLSQAEANAGNSEWQKALLEYNKILDMEPGNQAAQQGQKDMQTKLEVQRNLAVADMQMRAKQWVNAAATYEDILRVDPANTVAKTRIEEANERIRKEVETYFNAGIDLYTKDKYDEAVEKFQSVLALDPTNKAAHDYIQQAQERLAALRRIQPQ